ncbi:hypothetical protein PR048_012300 [Dryococelus australis]|uniref:Uncharacterized protein n=1 Tax=Dryococelus australis TaxID=614101 RepID=A0ABQ9HP51_9NEOP|nr:hypothetical protein PR048_012300 [Dryococelus australis]
MSEERRRNARTGETGDPREKPPTSGIVQHDSHLRTSGSGPEGGLNPPKSAGAIRATLPRTARAPLPPEVQGSELTCSVLVALRVCAYGTFSGDTYYIGGKSPGRFDNTISKRAIRATLTRTPRAPARKMLNWRAVFVLCCVYLWDFKR